jgi:hypothetical protein
MTYYRIALPMIVALCLLPGSARAEVSAAELLKGYDTSTGAGQERTAPIYRLVRERRWMGERIRKEAGSGASLLRTRKYSSAGRSAHRCLTKICGDGTGDEQASLDCRRR